MVALSTNPDGSPTGGLAPGAVHHTGSPEAVSGIARTPAHQFLETDRQEQDGSPWNYLPNWVSSFLPPESTQSFLQSSSTAHVAAGHARDAVADGLGTTRAHDVAGVQQQERLLRSAQHQTLLDGISQHVQDGFSFARAMGLKMLERGVELIFWGESTCC